MTDKNLYIIAGCNGAGKTTASYTILPEIIECKEFVNADEIAKGLSPFQSERVAIEAGKIMVNRINELLKKSIQNLFDIYLPIVDGAFLFDNSYGKPELIAQQMLNNDFEVINELKFRELKKYS